MADAVDVGGPARTVPPETRLQRLDIHVGLESEAVIAPLDAASATCVKLAANWSLVASGARMATHKHFWTLMTKQKPSVKQHSSQ
jgi:hypothetical protein